MTQFSTLFEGSLLENSDSQRQF